MLGKFIFNNFWDFTKNTCMQVLLLSRNWFKDFGLITLKLLKYYLLFARVFNKMDIKRK